MHVVLMVVSNKPTQAGAQRCDDPSLRRPDPDKPDRRQVLRQVHQGKAPDGFIHRSEIRPRFLHPSIFIQVSDY